MKRMIAALAIGASMGAGMVLPTMVETAYARVSCDDECQWHDEHDAYQDRKGHGGSGHHKGRGEGVRDRKFSA